MNPIILQPAAEARMHLAVPFKPAARQALQGSIDRMLMGR